MVEGSSAAAWRPSPSGRHGHHGEVIRLEYEAYIEMAEQVLAEIAEEIEREYVHVAIASARSWSATAVVIAAAAPHRAEASRFAAPQSTVCAARADLEKRDRYARRRVDRDLRRGRTLGHANNLFQPTQLRGETVRQLAHACRIAGGDGRHRRGRCCVAGGARARPAGRADGNAGAGDRRERHRQGAVSRARCTVPRPAPRRSVRGRTAAPPRELAESELFRHERGAFTGAAGRGWFEEASGGTLVLDEIGERRSICSPSCWRAWKPGASAASVASVSRVSRWRDSVFRRRGAATSAPTFTTGWPIFELVLPPLRRRRGDIPLLVRHFLREVEREVGTREVDPAVGGADRRRMAR